MKPGRDAVYVRHMLDAIERVESYIAGVSHVEFLALPMMQDAVIRQIQVLGEAAKRVSPRLREETPVIPWTDITGMREKLVHDYMRVDLDIVWKAATVDLRELKIELEGLV